MGQEFKKTPSPQKKKKVIKKEKERLEEGKVLEKGAETSMEKDTENGVKDAGEQ